MVSWSVSINDEGGLSTSFISSPYRRNRCRRPVADPVASAHDVLLAFASFDTHLPKAFALFLLVPYFSLNAAML